MHITTPRSSGLLRRRTTAFAAVALLLTIAGGCSQPAPPPAAPPSSPSVPPTQPITAYSPPAADPSAQCGEGGRRFDGRIDGCGYLHQGCCYVVAESACAVAGCAGLHCTIIESLRPPQVSCIEPAVPHDVPDDGCNILHEGVCYASREAACEAAACPLDRCVLQKSLPGSISCIER